jgi:hypothetical protein
MASHNDEYVITTTTTSADEGSDRIAPFDLLSGILEGTPSELSLLVQSHSDLLAMHHQQEPLPARTIAALESLARHLWNMDNEPSATRFIDYDEYDEGGGRSVLNPDGRSIRQLIVAVARATLIKNLIVCVAVQRRMVTGRPYEGSPPIRPTLAPLAQRFARWTAYAPVPEAEVEALFYQARQNDHPEHRKTAEIIDMARNHWAQTVIPAIRQRYRGETPEKTE